MLAPITDPPFYLVAVAAVLLVGISKGGFGGGGLFAVPAMALIVPPAQAAAIMLPILLIMDGVGVHAYRRRFDRGAMAVMLPGAVLGIAAGGFAFGLLDPDAMRLLIGALALGFVAWEVLGRAAGCARRRGRAPGSGPCAAGSRASPAPSLMPAARPRPSTSCRCASTRRCSSAAR